MNIFLNIYHHHFPQFALYQLYALQCCMYIHHMVWNNASFIILYHTLFLALTSAPWAIRYSATATWPSSHANIKAVHSSCMKNETTKVMHLIRQNISPLKQQFCNAKWKFKIWYQIMHRISISSLYEIWISKILLLHNWDITY